MPCSPARDARRACAGFRGYSAGWSVRRCHPAIGTASASCLASRAPPCTAPTSCGPFALLALMQASPRAATSQLYLTTCRAARPWLELVRRSRLPMCGRRWQPLSAVPTMWAPPRAAIELADHEHLARELQSDATLTAGGKAPAPSSMHTGRSQPHPQCGNGRVRDGKAGRRWTCHSAPFVGGFPKGYQGRSLRRHEGRIQRGWWRDASVEEVTKRRGSAARMCAWLATLTTAGGSQQ